MDTKRHKPFKTSILFPVSQHITWKAKKTIVFSGEYETRYKIQPGGELQRWWEVSEQRMSMKRLFAALRYRNDTVVSKILIIISIVYAVCGGPYSCIAQTFSATVKKVIDGDSLLVTTGKRNIEVRLYGIDAPEFDQPSANNARIFVQKWAGRQSVQIQGQYKDSYGRTVAIILKDRRILNEDLVQEGLAWVYPRYCRKDICNQWTALEIVARDAKRGLWQNTQAIAPWRWKRQRKGRE